MKNINEVVLEKKNELVNLRSTAQGLHAQIKQVEEDLQALERASKLMGVDIQNKETVSPQLNLQDGITNAKAAELVLLDSKKPLHIEKIRHGIIDRFGKDTSRAVLEVALSRSMKKDNVFSKTNAATYGLAMWDKNNSGVYDGIKTNSGE